jgi:hypothetical protein
MKLGFLLKKNVAPLRACGLWMRAAAMVTSGATITMTIREVDRIKTMQALVDRMLRSGGLDEVPTDCSACSAERQGVNSVS